MLGLRSKAQLGSLLARLDRIADEPLAHLSVNAWLDRPRAATRRPGSDRDAPAGRHLRRRLRPAVGRRRRPPAPAGRPPGRRLPRPRLAAARRRAVAGRGRPRRHRATRPAAPVALRSDGSRWVVETATDRAADERRRAGRRIARRHPPPAPARPRLGARPRLHRRLPRPRAAPPAVAADRVRRRRPALPVDPLPAGHAGARRARPSCTCCATVRAPPRPTRRSCGSLAATAGITEADVVTDRFLHRMVVSHALPQPGPRSGRSSPGGDPRTRRRHDRRRLGRTGRHAGRRQPGQRRMPAGRAAAHVATTGVGRPQARPPAGRP